MAAQNMRSISLRATCMSPAPACPVRPVALIYCNGFVDEVHAHFVDEWILQNS
jgi:hypothetical protein